MEFILVSKGGSYSKINPCYPSHQHTKEERADDQMPKNTSQNPTPIHDKNSPKTRNKEECLQLDK